MNRIKTKLAYYSFGSFLLSLGITLSIFSNLGAGAFDALNSNFSNLINISIGNAMYISIILVYIMTMILRPKAIYFIGLLLTFLVGFGIDTWSQIIPDIGDTMGLRFMYFTASLILLPLGVTFIIKSKLPLSPMDNLLVIVVDKSKWSIALIKTLLEISYVLIALIYGISAGIGIGAISVGTVLITFGIGPGIAFFMKYVRDIAD